MSSIKKKSPPQKRSHNLLIGCGLGGSTFAENIAKRFPEHFEIHSQFITADCDSNNFTQEKKIPNTERGSGKSLYDGKNNLYPVAKKYLIDNKTLDDINDKNVFVCVALGGGSGNAIKSYICDVLSEHKRNNNVVLVPILPMVQEGMSASSNASFGFKDIIPLAVGTERRISVIPINLESVRAVLDTNNMQLIQKRIELIFMTIVLFKEFFITSNIKASFTIDKAEYDSVLYGSRDLVKDAKSNKTHVYANRGLGLLAYSITDLDNVSETQLPSFEMMSPNASTESIIKSSTDISLSICLNNFAQADKIRSAERVFLNLQKMIHDLNPDCRVIAGFNESPTGRDTVFILTSGSDITSVADYYYQFASKSFRQRNTKIDATTKKVNQKMRKYKSNEKLEKV